MKELVQKIRSNILLSILFAMLFGIIVMVLSRYFNGIIKLQLEKLVELNFYTGNVSYKLLMLFFSLLFILIINNGSLKDYGFRKPEKIKILKSLFISIAIIIGSFIIGNIIFNGVLRTLFPVGSEIKGFPNSRSILETILTVWIWSSICEEVLTRGLVQSFMNYHVNVKFLKLSIPVWVSGIFFGAMHLSLLKTDMDIWFVSFIVFNTTVLGLLAAFYREKTKSIYPAIFLHFLANVIGSLPAIIMGIN